MTSETDAARARIHQQAAAKAEATVYSLNNPYLTDYQKAQVEVVYQFPLAAFGYTFGVAALAFGQSFGMSYGIATAVSLITWIAARYLPGKAFIYPGFLFAGNISSLISLGLAAWALVESRWWIAGFMVADAVGVASFLTLPMHLWSMTSPGLNAKYAIAKRMFGIRFPFEADLRSPRG